MNDEQEEFEKFNNFDDYYGILNVSKQVNNQRLTFVKIKVRKVMSILF